MCNTVELKSSLQNSAAQRGDQRSLMSSVPHENPKALSVVIVVGIRSVCERLVRLRRIFESIELRVRFAAARSVLT